MKFLHYIIIWQLSRLRKQQAKLRQLHSKTCTDDTCIGHIL